MKMPKISKNALHVQYDVAVWKHGYVWLLIAGAGLVLLGLEVLWQSKQSAHLQTAKVELARAQQQLLDLQKNKLSGTNQVEQNSSAESVKNHTISQQEVGKVLQRVVELGNANKVVLTQSEFQTSNEGHGGLRQIQVTVPLRANYKALRAFIEDMLRQLPMLSVDQVGIKREAITQEMTETRLKLSIWVDPQKLTSVAQTAPTTNVLAGSKNP